MTSRQILTIVGLLAALVSMAIFMSRIETDGSAVGASLGTFPSSTPRVGELISTSQVEIISRLREILRIREEAYRSRSRDMLASIYSRDCPCLASDGKAIDDLLRMKRIWDGVETSIEVHAATKVNERLWTVVGSFRSETLFVRTEGGTLVRTEPAGRDNFRFTLVKLQDEQEWLLGLVSDLEGPR